METSSIHENLAGHSEIRSSSNRSFGLVMAAAFLVIAMLPLLRGGRIRFWAIAAALVFACLAVVAPSSLKLLNRGWTAFGLMLGKITNPVVLTLLYYIVFAPVGALMRASGKDPLRLKASPSTDSYWIDRSKETVEAASMRRQF